MNHAALLIPGLDRIGGAERQVILLAKGLRKRGWRVSVVALSGEGGQAAADLMSSGVTFLSLKMRKGWADPRGWIRFHRWLRQETPDVLHAHLAHAAWLVRWSRLAAPARVVVDTLHSSSTGSLGRRLGYLCSNWLPDKVTAVSHAVADAHTSARMVSPGKLIVLPNGVDVEAWQPDAALRIAVRQEFGLKEEFLWFAAGRLDQVKDYPSLLRAMAAVPEPALLLIAGTGPLENGLLRLCAHFGLKRRVRFVGFDPDVHRSMQAADGFVLSSLWEGLPMGLLEASACGLPAVATDVPGTREAVAPGQRGSLTPAGDASSLAKAMTTIMYMTPAERRAIGDKARQYVIDCFSLETVLDRWEALYADLLKQNLKPKRWAHAE